MFSAPPQGFFNEPPGMTFDNAGNLYVADSVNQRIQQFTPGADGAGRTVRCGCAAAGAPAT
jgi:hypothetical protein